MKKRTKRIFSIHHWCGLIAGIFLLAMSVSGSILVFHDEIDHAFFHPQMRLHQPAGKLSFDRSFEHVRKNNPGWEIRVPALPEQGEALKYELRKDQQRKWILVHPETGQLLSTIERADRRLVNLLLTFHYSFFAGIAGKVLVLLIGLAFLILLVTGLVLYRKSLLKALLLKQRFSLKSKRSFFSSVHRLLGVWGLVFNILVCITGIRIAYVVTSAAINTSDSTITVPSITQSIDEVLSEVETAYPEFKATYLRFPTTTEGKLLLLGHLRSDPLYYGKAYSNIAVNYHTGEVDAITLLSDKPLPDRFLTILQPLHFGDYAGTWIKLIYSIGGLLPGILGVSGFLIWRHQRTAARAQARRVLELQRQ